MEKIDNKDGVWYWICENIGVVQEVTEDGNCGYCYIIGACNHTKRTLGVNLLQMRSTKQDFLNIQKYLKKWCHKNHHLYIEENKSRTKYQLF